MVREIILVAIGSTAFTALVNALIEIIKNAFGKKSKTDKAINFCLLHNIQTYGKELLSLDRKITREEYLQFTEMYDCYKSLGGNGFVDKLKTEIDNLIDF